MSYLERAKEKEDLTGYTDFEITKALHAKYKSDTGQDTPFEDFAGEIGLQLETTPLELPPEETTRLEQPEPAPIVPDETAPPIDTQPAQQAAVEIQQPPQTGFGMDLPVQTEEEQPVDNDVGRMQTAAGSFVKGAGHVAASTIKSAAMVAQNNRNRILNDFNLIDSGESPAGVATPEVMSYSRHPEQRESLRAVYEDIGGEDPRESNVYKAGNAIDNWLSENIKTNPRFEQEFFTGKVAGGLGSMVMFVVANLIGRGALRTTGLGPGAAGAASTATAGAAVQASDTFEDAINNGADLQTAFDAAKLGAVVGTSEAIPIVAILGRLDKSSGGGVREVIGNLLKEGTEEALQEAFQSIAGNMIAQKMYDPDRKMWTGAGEGAGVGFTTGALVSFLASMIGLKSRGKGQGPQGPQEQQPGDSSEPGFQPEAPPPEDSQAFKEWMKGEPTEDEIQADRQAEATADLEEFMADDRPAEEIIAERRAKEEADTAAAQAEEQAQQETEAAALAQEDIDAERFQQEFDLAEEQRQQQEMDVGFDQADQVEQAQRDEVLDYRIQQDQEAEAQPTAMQLAMEKAKGDGTQKAPIKVETAQDVELAASRADTDPSKDQEETGAYEKGHANMHGMHISIENAKGSIRSGVDAGGKAWETVMPAHYGYIRGTVGADSKPGAKPHQIEQVDVYIGDNPESKSIFMVDQIDPKTGDFDEAKVIFGTTTQADAEALYDAGFSDGSGASRRGAVTAMGIAQFKRWLKKGNTKKAFRYESPKADKPKKKVTKSRKALARSVDPKKDDLFSAIAKLGGVNRKESIAQGVDKADFNRRGHRVYRVYTKNGISFDDMAQKLAEHGYPVVDDQGNYDPNVLLDRLQEAMGGKKVLTSQGLEEYAEQESRYEDEYRAELDALADITDNFDQSAKDLSVEIHEVKSKLGEDRVDSIIERVSIQSEALSADEYELELVKAFQEALSGKQQDADDTSLKKGYQGRKAGREPGKETEGPAFDLAQQEVIQPTPTPEPLPQGDMFGGKSETAQVIKDREVARQKKERDAPPMEAGEGDLFSGKSKQVDIEDVKPSVKDVLFDSEIAKRGRAQEAAAQEKADKFKQPDTKDVKPTEQAGVKDLNGNTIPSDLMIEVNVDVVDSGETGTATFNAAETMSELQAKQKSYKALQDCMR